MKPDRCREDIDWYITQECCEDGNDKWIDYDDYIDVIQNIEDMVNRIKDKIEDIKGIDIIDEANELLDKLGDYVY